MAIYLFPFLFFALLAVLYQLRLLRLNRTFYGLALLAIGLFAGLRLETGHDWLGYEVFFQNLDLSQNPIDLYFNERFVQPPYEIGYYLLNYAVKYFGGTYSVVFLLASLFCVYALYRFTHRLAVNRFYILTIYTGYSFLILHFAQVRQSIAIALFLLGCDYYRRHRKVLTALAICLLGLFFQYSAIFYIILLILVLGWSKVKRNKFLWAFSLCLVTILTLYVINCFFDFYSLLTLIVPSIYEYKIRIYKETQLPRGIGVLVFGPYLLLLVIYFIRYSRHLTEEQAFISRFAIFSILLTVVLIIIFPGSYVMYSRAYVMACIFQACAASLIFAARKGLLHRAVFIGSMAVALVYYLRILTLNHDQYVPYLSIIIGTVQKVW